MKKVISTVLALVIAFSLVLTVFGASGDSKLKDLDTSAINGTVVTYVGVTESVVFYPVPLEAENEFDIRNAQITVDDESIVSAKAHKVEEYRFGSVEVTGLKKGKTFITVTDKSGVSVKVNVTVRPKIIYDIKNFRNNLEYLPYFLFMAIARLFNLK